MFPKWRGIGVLDACAGETCSRMLSALETFPAALRCVGDEIVTCRTRVTPRRQTTMICPF